MASDGPVVAPIPPPPNAAFDYQLGGGYPPPADVRVVSRDRHDSPAVGFYNICYVNGFQTQPDEEAFWLGAHPELILRDAAGDPVVDPDWNEMLLDIRTPETRSALTEIVGGWIAQCARDGFDAVEIDNLDTYSRSGGAISIEDAIAFQAGLSDLAHANGLAIAQKNAAEIASRRAELHTDFAVVEECARYDECPVFTDAYGRNVLEIEYERASFDAACADHPDLSVILRDVDLTTPSDPSYVYDAC
ncbi:MAG: endo alpha-1,4 polygalactosaminidase [Sandaracinus sp.]